MLKCKLCGKELKIIINNNPYNSDIYYIDTKVVCGECFKKYKEKM